MSRQQRVRVGDIRRGVGLRDWVVLAVGRGRAGEDRTVYTMGYLGEDGIVRPQCTYGHQVRRMPLIGRLRLRVTRHPHVAYISAEVLP